MFVYERSYLIVHIAPGHRALPTRTETVAGEIRFGIRAGTAPARNRRRDLAARRLRHLLLRGVHHIRGLVLGDCARTLGKIRAHVRSEAAGRAHGRHEAAAAAGRGAAAEAARAAATRRATARRTAAAVREHAATIGHVLLR